MTDQIPGQLARYPNASVSALVVIGLGLLNLLAIAGDFQEPLTPFPFSPPMSWLAANSFVLLGLAIIFKLLKLMRLSLICSGFCAACIPFIYIYDSTTAPAIDCNLVPEARFLGAFTFGLASFLVVTNHWLPQRRIGIYDALITIFTLIPLLSVFAYIFDPVAMYASYFQWVLPVPTAAGLLLLFFAIVSQTKSKGAAGLLTRKSHYAKNFQWLFMLVLIVPLSIGSSLALAVDLGYLRAGFGAAIFCLLATLLIATVLANNAIVQESWLKKIVREQRKNSELQNHISEVLELSPDAILLLDEQMKILHANHGAAVLFGWPQEALREANFGTLIPAEHYSRFERLIRRFFLSTRLSLSQSKPINILIQNRFGEQIPASLNLSKRQPAGASHIVAVLRNNSEVANRILDLEKQIKVDALTGAGSRVEFDNYCARLSRSQRRSERNLAVLVLDIDNFKGINDTYGHPTGDRVLQTFGHTTQNCLRNGDQLFRIGGEEFAVVATHIDEGGAQLLAERIRTIIKAKPMATGPKNLYVTCSIGVALTAAQHIQEAISDADQALYTAKRTGRDRVVIHADA